MEVLRRAPMLGVLAGLAAGAALYDRAGVWAFAVMVPAVYCAVMFSSYEAELPEQWRAFAVGLVLCALCSWRMYAVFTRPPAQNLTLSQASGTVQSVRSWGRTYVAVIDVDGGGCYVTRMHFANVMPGDRIAFDGVTRSFRASDKDGGFDESRYWGARGVSAWVSLRNIRELPGRFSLARMRCTLSRKLSMYLPERVASYLKAAWIGERDDSLNAKHRRWGTVHILAVSGFHVGIVLLFAGVLFGNNALILSVILWAYVLLSGAAPSAVRAGLMLQAGLISRELGRSVNSVNSVSVAGVGILMYSPLMFWDIGFRLSVLAALTISALPYRRYSWLLMSPLISLVTFPQVSYTFGGIVVVGLVLNLVAPVYFAFAFTIASVAGALRIMGVPLMKYFVLASEGIFMLWERVADFAAGVLPYSVEWNYFAAWAGTGALMFCVSRYFGLAPLRVLAVMIGGSFAAFVMFL